MISPVRYTDRYGKEILAVQLSKNNGAAIWEWADSKPFREFIDGEMVTTGLNILHPRGRIKAEFGDWIVRQADGTFRPFKPAAFESEFTPVELSRAGEPS